MLKVQLASQLITALTASGQDPEELKSNFTEWKSGEPEEHYWFSRDVKGDLGLFHAHLIPRNDLEKRSQWDSDWGDYRKRRSDRYLLYANGGLRYGYLLIDVIEDPGAHDLWTSAQRRRLSNFETIADNFTYFGQVP